MSLLRILSDAHCRIIRSSFAECSPAAPLGGVLQRRAQNNTRLHTYAERQAGNISHRLRRPSDGLGKVGILGGAAYRMSEFSRTPRTQFPHLSCVQAVPAFCTAQQFCSYLHSSGCENVEHDN